MRFRHSFTSDAEVSFASGARLGQLSPAFLFLGGSDTAKHTHSDAPGLPWPGLLNAQPTTFPFLPGTPLDNEPPRTNNGSQPKLLLLFS